MVYRTLYRKYRPKTFDDVCGQEFIVQTLKHSIRLGKTSHAYLFCGTRGTGKTTIAKVFARNVNCINMTDGNPCGKCELCVCENTDNVDDIIEIDAASNNGVDEIRELKNKIGLAPLQYRYKVYIIDEVHMLSTGAFNALLKTLEEPPSHVIFILATTEPQKIPMTIISRCQRFDFKKIPYQLICNRLRYIAINEKIDIDDDCIYEIARMSDGALRDAIGLLDQISSFSRNKISLDDIYKISGETSYEVIIKLLNSYCDNDISDILEIIDKEYQDGKDFKKICEKMLDFLRNIYVHCKAPIYFESKNYINSEEIIRIADRLSLDKVQKMIMELTKLCSDIKSSEYPKILFEMFFLSNLNYESLKKTYDKEKNIKKVINDVKDNTKETKNDVDLNKKVDKIFKVSNLSVSREALINNTIALANSEEKKYINNIFLKLDEYLLDENYSEVASLLKDAVVTAASIDHILLTYKYIGMVEDIEKNIAKVISLVKLISKKNYAIVALTIEEWKNKRPYYVDLKNKNGNIELVEEKIQDEASNKICGVESSLDFFGEDIIEMKG